MQRLTIHLKFVEPVNNKVFNTVSYNVKSTKQVSDYLASHKDNINKFYISNK